MSDSSEDQTTRQVVVDDNDSSIVYSNTWVALTNQPKSGLGNFGPTLKSTLHGTNTNGSFKYEFSGTQMEVYGTSNLTNSSGSADPSWECLIDGISIGATTPFAFPENNWLLCSADNLTNTHHTLTVNAVSKGRFFYFDYLRYIPSSPNDFSSSIVYVPHKDPGIVYDSNWQALGATASVTQANGSSAKFQFTGVSVTWYAITPSELPISPSKGTYSIDGGPSQPFVLPGLAPQEVTLYNQVVFETSTLPNGLHSITVTYEGDNSTTPLTLSHLLVQNATSSISAAGASTSKTVSNSAGLATSTHSQNPAKIAAAVLGSILFLCIVAFILVRYRKYRKNGRKTGSKRWENIVKPFKFSLSRQPPRPIESGSMSTLGLFGPPEEAQRRRKATPGYSAFKFSPLRRVISEPEIEEVSQPPLRPALPPLSIPQAAPQPPPPPPTSKPQTRAVQLPTEQPEASGSNSRRKHKGKSKEKRTAAIEQLGENDLYYGGYQTWGQTKALEAASGARARDSYC